MGIHRPDTRVVLALCALVVPPVACSAHVKGERPMRSMKYTAQSAQAALAWQHALRGKLFGLLKLDDLLRERDRTPLQPTEERSERTDGYVRKEVTLNSTPGRRFEVVVTIPADGAGPFPAVVCIHGHGGTRVSTYDKGSIYKGFAAELASRGFVTIAADVGQHVVYEPGRTLMGERLWDLMRCVDYLRTLPAVAPDRIGCAGLSLGGEMAMWLGAMDTRIRATVSCGFLTRMDQMEQNHCMCWKFDGLRELVDFADIYALTAPRALLCQNGRGEPPTQFTPAIARAVLPEIRAAYADLGKPRNVSLDVHDGEHEVDLPALLRYLGRHLAGRR